MINFVCSDVETVLRRWEAVEIGDTSIRDIVPAGLRPLHPVAKTKPFGRPQVDRGVLDFELSRSWWNAQCRGVGHQLTAIRDDTFDQDLRYVCLPGCAGSHAHEALCRR